MKILSLKRLTVIVSVFAHASLLWAQTPQELKDLRERAMSFAYTTNVEKVSAEEYKITLSSGENFTLLCGNSKDKAFSAIDINDDAVVAKLHKGKPIVINRKPDQKGALLALYNATKGKSWNRNEGWGNAKSDIGGWAGVKCNGEGNVISLNLSNNNLQGKLPDVFYAFPALEDLQLNNNQLTGTLPRSLGMLPDNCVVNVKYNTLAQSTLYVPRHRIPVVAKNIEWYPQNESNEFRLYVDCDVDLNPTNGYRADNECRLYHKATEGKGVNLYVVGEGYDRAEHAVGGTADYWLERAADAIFDIKPLCDLKHLINVYIVYAHSPERGVGMDDSARNSRFGYWIKKAKPFKTQEVYDTCKASATNAGFKFEDEGTVYVLMVANCTKLGGVEYSRSAKETGGSRHIRIGITTTFEKWFNALVWHEFIGHGIGRLLDEYSKGKPKKIYEKDRVDRANLDVESDPTKVKWARFIADPRYADEGVGVFQGARGYANLYRPSKNSVMRSNRPDKRFNVPSRAEIYKVIMELAYPGWKFDYEEFVKFDLGEKYYPITNN